MVDAVDAVCDGRRTERNVAPHQALVNEGGRLGVAVNVELVFPGQLE